MEPLAWNIPHLKIPACAVTELLTDEDTHSVTESATPVATYLDAVKHSSYVKWNWDWDIEQIMIFLLLGKLTGSNNIGMSLLGLN